MEHLMAAHLCANVCIIVIYTSKLILNKYIVHTARSLPSVLNVIISVCGENLTSSSGVITSPNFPQDYPANKKCEWNITAPRGKQITLSFTDFVLEDHDSCQFDYVEVSHIS